MPRRSCFFLLPLSLTIALGATPAPAGAAKQTRGALQVRMTEKVTRLGPGLSMTRMTTRLGKRSEVKTFVGWKNAAAVVPAPLTASQVERLSRELGSGAGVLAASARALLAGSSRRAVPALQLEQALRRMGISTSADFR
jgi:hypothetical protein